MSTLTRTFCCALFLMGHAVAQSPPNAYNGTWMLGMDGSRTVDMEGTVVVRDDGGTWRVLARSRGNPCVGREAPIAVKSATDTELVFEVNRSQVLAGCRDWTMRFRKLDDGKLTGQLTDGRLVTLTRQ